jgi:hypothetical protein
MAHATAAFRTVVQPEARVIAICTLVSLVLGATTAVISERYPDHLEALETAAGVLLVGGLGLIGAGLPIFI